MIRNYILYIDVKKEPKLLFNAFKTEHRQPGRSRDHERRKTHQAAPTTTSRLIGSVMSINVVMLMRDLPADERLA